MLPLEGDAPVSYFPKPLEAGTAAYLMLWLDQLCPYAKIYEAVSRKPHFNLDPLGISDFFLGIFGGYSLVGCLVKIGWSFL